MNKIHAKSTTQKTRLELISETQDLKEYLKDARIALSTANKENDRLKAQVKLYGDVNQAQRNVMTAEREVYNTVLQHLCACITEGHDNITLSIPINADGYPDFATIYKIGETINSLLPLVHPPILIGARKKQPEQELKGFPRGWKIEDAARIFAKQFDFPFDALAFANSTGAVVKTANHDVRYKIIGLLSLAGFKHGQIAHLANISLFKLSTIISVFNEAYGQNDALRCEIDTIVEKIPALVESYNIY